MSKLRSINTAIWSDVWFEELTTSEKLLFIYLITNEKTNMLGVYEVSIKKIAFETSIDKATVEKALKGFERDGKIKYAVNRVILYNYLKHQSFNFNMKKSAIDCYNNLPIELKGNKLPVKIERDDKGFETLCNGFGIVRKVEVELEVELEVEKECKSPATKKTFIPPSITEVKEYFTEKGYNEVLAEKFFNSYAVAEWKDSNGRKILNWKQKAINVWFKEENKIKPVSQSGLTDAEIEAKYGKDPFAHLKYENNINPNWKEK